MAILGLSPLFSSHATIWQNKISSSLLNKINHTTQTELIIQLNDSESGVQPIAPKYSNNRIQKLQHKVTELKAQAKTSQQAVINYLNQHNIKYQSFWVSNAIWVEANKEQVIDLLNMNQVKYVYHNEPYHLKLPRNNQSTTKATNGIEWHIDKIKAPAVWSLGIKGQNVVIAGQDTGYQWNHPALINQYRGWNGLTADHNYNWHDSIISPQLDCGSAPCDDNSHGTHTMGTMVGDDGAGNQIGVAPEAQWVGCRNMDLGYGTPATYMDCFQWFLEPTDLNGENPDINKAPHIINNSWGCPGFEGCTDPNILLDTVKNVDAAGILVVVSAGNSGANCNTISTPAAIYKQSLTVGSTTSSDLISDFSSRGSVNVDGSNRTKPDISAPGSSIRSASNNGSYAIKSGTSMAGPNVAGLAALVLSANPQLEGKTKMLKHVITHSSEPKTTAQSCGGIDGTEIPNNTFGYGRVDALAAVNYAIDLIFYEDFD